MSISRLSFFSFLVALLLLPATAQAQATRTVQRTIDLDADGSVSVSTFSGAIDVTTWDRASVEIEVRIEAESQSSLDRTEIEFGGSGSRLDIAADFDEISPSNWSRSIDVPDTYFTIKMPRRANLETKVFSATVSGADLGGDVDIEAFSGDIDVQRIDGELRVDVYSGNLTATDARGPVTHSSFSGDATVTVDDLADDVSINTFSGDATVSLAANAAFDLRADTGMGGSLRAEGFDVHNLRTDDGYRGAINGGGPRLAFETFSGAFRLRAR